VMSRVGVDGHLRFCRGLPALSVQNILVSSVLTLQCMPDCVINAHSWKWVPDQDVRKAVIHSVAASQTSLADILNRTRDVNDEVDAVPEPSRSIHDHQKTILYCTRVVNPPGMLCNWPSVGHVLSGFPRSAC
jgi:hypothetical protein